MIPANWLIVKGRPIHTVGFARTVERAGEVAGLCFKAHPHMLRHARGSALANKGHDTRALQGYLGYKNIQHTVRYTELSPVGSRISGDKGDQIIIRKTSAVPIVPRAITPDLNSGSAKGISLPQRLVAGEKQREIKRARVRPGGRFSATSLRFHLPQPRSLHDAL
jgi:hypothetical protein